MRITPIEPPREFPAGHGIMLRDCAHIALQPDEQVTFQTDSGAEYDVARKPWGFYATPSVNARLRSQGFKTALVRSAATGRYFVMLVEMTRLAEFQAYAQSELLDMVEWLDERN
jgi:hypothetical protein